MRDRVNRVAFTRPSSHVPAGAEPSLSSERTGATTKRDIADARAWLQTRGRGYGRSRGAPRSTPGPTGQTATVARPDCRPCSTRSCARSLTAICWCAGEARRCRPPHSSTRRTSSSWTSRARSGRTRVHFLALAAVAMRHVLVDRARERVALKRGGGRAPITLGDESASAPMMPDGAARAARCARTVWRSWIRGWRSVVECRFFGGHVGGGRSRRRSTSPSARCSATGRRRVCSCAPR